MANQSLVLKFASEKTASYFSRYMSNAIKTPKVDFFFKNALFSNISSASLNLSKFCIFLPFAKEEWFLKFYASKNYVFLKIFDSADFTACHKPCFGPWYLQFPPKLSF